MLSFSVVECQRVAHKNDIQKITQLVLNASLFSQRHRAIHDLYVNESSYRKINGMLNRTMQCLELTLIYMLTMMMMIICANEIFLLMSFSLYRLASLPSSFISHEIHNNAS